MLQPLARPFHLVLVSPQIPPNTGNIARLCAVTGCRLILVEPLGFSIDDRHLKRAGLDYWDKVFLKLYPDYDAYLAEWPSARRFLFSARAATSLYEARFEEGDHLVFGSETQGLPQEIIGGGSGTAVTIPMLPERRSLNLSTSVGIAAYEALRQVQFGAAAGRAGTPS
ncbi:tRNA (uridine(34)/cytosine(34)/5-carboxymethylaminomethyluridine(34)-2'-O)-methyltransferase TrmL [Archangium sp. Cb G35]|uniref:tRNA (cytidine(34)-2'-O)-methyltransferase n=1 Tax=Archangium sp. Cb G35 TaxID=1920190 RepID=UPI000935F0CF|nr:tRNA (cytidine(34)-2'-O)-methyltransferase [Archangium sp. Cb G35]OJT25955.1 tRNA (uridine(34)/cytosine(34)/5-carboxymethylaminomethyluridine(34)-2'-O)-methyltransferase TrmL [Archangium sp. Cb G35]